MHEHDHGGQDEAEATERSVVDQRLGPRWLRQRADLAIRLREQHLVQPDADVLLGLRFGQVFILDDFPLRGELERRQLLVLEPRTQLGVDGPLRKIFRDVWRKHKCASDFLTVRFAWDAETDGRTHEGVLRERLLDLIRADLLAAFLDKFLCTAFEAEETFRVEDADVAREEILVRHVVGADARKAEVILAVGIWIVQVIGQDGGA